MTLARVPGQKRFKTGKATPLETLAVSSARTTTRSTGDGENPLKPLDHRDSMLRFALGFPVTVFPFFWISCILLSGAFNAQTKEDWIFVVLNTVAIFISIMVHEFGHAIAARIFGERPEIALHAMGGVTVYHAAFNRWRRIIVTAAGPLAGLALYFFSTYLAHFPQISSAVVFATLVDSMIFINLVWTIFNLLPILPLDGGQILRDILGPRGFRATCIIGGIVGILVSAYMLLHMQIFVAIYCAYLTYLNLSNKMDNTPHPEVP